MAKLGRFCGTVLAESNGESCIVGDLKTPDENNGRDVIDANWLTGMPDEIWEIVQDQMLRCR